LPSRHALVLGEDLGLDHPSGLVVQGMGHVLELAVLLLAAGHADEQPVPALDGLDVVDHETMIEDDRPERLELLLLNRENLDLCDLHCALSPSAPNLQSGKPWFQIMRNSGRSVGTMLEVGDSTCQTFALTLERALEKSRSGGSGGESVGGIAALAVAVG